MSGPDFDERADDVLAERADQARLHDITDQRPSPPPERCPRHGLYEFTLWGGCPSCEDEDAAAWEAEKVARSDRPHFVRQKPEAA